MKSLHPAYGQPPLVTDEPLLVIAFSFPDIAYFIICNCRMFLTSLFLYVGSQWLYVSKFVSVHWSAMTGRVLNWCDLILHIINKLLGNISIMNTLTFCQILSLILVLKKQLIQVNFFIWREKRHQNDYEAGLTTSIYLNNIAFYLNFKYPIYKQHWVCLITCCTSLL